MNALFKQATACFQRGDYGQAAALCERLATEDPANADAPHMLGIIALRSNDFARAARMIGRAAEINPNDYTIQVNRSQVLRGLRQFEGAVAAIEKALSLNPDGADAYLQLGFCRMGLGELEVAEEALAQAMRLKPDWPDALEAAANASYHRGNMDAALKTGRRALDLEPNRAVSHRVVASVHLRRHEYDEAFRHYKRSLDLDPSDQSTQSGFALLLARMGRNEESAQVFGRLTSEKLLSDPAVKHAHGMVLLAQGNFTQGWPLYAARHALFSEPLFRRASNIAPTAQPPLKGKRLLAWTEQGVGEEIMFASLVPDLVRAGAEVTVECSGRLAALFARSFPDVRVIARIPSMSPSLAGFDAQLSLADAAARYRTDFSKFPRHSGYLKANGELAASLAATYRAGRPNHILVGISWRTSEERQGKIHGHKSIPLTEWGPVLHVPGLIFVNLQYGNYVQEVIEAERACGIKIISDRNIDPLGDLDKFAAQVAAMDLVITSSNATAHMAGALNVPVWTFVARGIGGVWHWFLQREDSPWYPSMRLIRQAEQGQWGPSVDNASASLVDFVADFHSSK